MAWFFLSRIAAALIAVITLLALTRLLEPDDFARYSIIVLSGAILQQFTFNWIISSLTRFHGVEAYAGRVVAIGIGATAASAVLLAIVLLPVALALSADWRETYLLTLALAWASAVHEMGLASLRVQGRGPIFAFCAVLRPVLSTSLAIVVVLGGWGHEGAVAALAGASLVSGGIGVAAAGLRDGVDRPSASILRTFFAFGQPLSAVGAGAMLFPLSNQLIMGSLVGLEQVGFFAASMTLSDRSLTMLMLTMGQTSAATIFHVLERDPDKLSEVLERHFSLLLLVSVPLFAVLILSSRTVAGVFFAPEFVAAASPFLALLAVSSFVQGLQGGFFAFIFEIRRETAVQLAFAAGFLLLHLAVCYGLILTTASLGAAYATIFTAVVMTGAFAWYGWPLFRRCNLLEPTWQMAVAALATAPILLAADHLASGAVALALIGLAMVAMLAVLAALRYRTLGPILHALRRPRRH